MYRYRIDKTAGLEEKIQEMPSIYIEAGAAFGKTTAVLMLLEKHPEVTAEWLLMDRELKHPEHLYGKLKNLRERMMNERLWVIFENLPANIPVAAGVEMADFVMLMPVQCRVIFVSREKPQAELLELIWKQKLEVIPHEALLFTAEEIRKWNDSLRAKLCPENIVRLTGGWPGCVSMLMYMASQDTEYNRKQRKTEDYFKCHEMAAYFRNEILNMLSETEQKLTTLAVSCPWLTEELCRETEESGQVHDVLENLSRKGILTYEPVKKRWKIILLFREFITPSKAVAGKAAVWYEKSGYIEEAIQCLRVTEDKNAYYDCLIRHYDKIPFLDEAYGDVMILQENLPELCYLRGMYCYVTQNMEGLDREIQKLKKAGKDRRTREILLNLLYVKPDFPLESLLDFLNDSLPICPGMRLYGVLGDSFSLLCGRRDLSGLFACTKKEENRRAEIWKEGLGKLEWKYFRLARMEYYLETERKSVISQEDWELLEEEDVLEDWQLRMGKFYLMCRLQRMFYDPEREDSIRYFADTLKSEENAVCIRNVEAIENLFSRWRKEADRLTRWLRSVGPVGRMEAGEDNYAMLCCMAKGYLILGQYEKAERISCKVIAHIKHYCRNRILAELYFIQAIAHQAQDRHGQALRCMIESFQVNGNRRYVHFYAEYGNQGREVLEAYVEWMKNNTPEGWHRKKKYHYGNVLRMPEADYMEVILRCAWKNVRRDSEEQNKEIREQFTMMEISVLQGIGSGLNNEELCEKLNLKLSTVKSHIYSLYKKLGANNRVQAILKGREMGLLD